MSLLCPGIFEEPKESADYVYKPGTVAATDSAYLYVAKNESEGTLNSDGCKDSHPYVGDRGNHLVRDLCRPDHGKMVARPPSSLNTKHRTEEHYTDGPCPDGAISTSHYDYGSGCDPIDHLRHPRGNEDEDVPTHSGSVNTSTKEANFLVTSTVEDTSGTLGSVVWTSEGGRGPDPRSSTGAFDHRTKTTKECLDSDRNTGNTHRESINKCVDECLTSHVESYD